MKRILFLIIMMVILADCGMESNPQEGLTNAVGLGWDEGVAAVFVSEVSEVTVNKVWTDMRPVVGTNRSNVSFRVEMAEDALNMGGNGPFYLYGGGVLQVEDSNFTFKDQNLIKGEGAGQMSLFQRGVDEAATTISGRPHLALTAQIDGLMAQPTDVTMVGTAHAGGQVMEILTTNENLITALETFQCEGRIIPDSNMASMTFTAKTEGGQVLIGAGIGLLEDAGIGNLIDGPNANFYAPFQCNMEGTGGVTYSAAVDGIEGAQLVDLVIEGLKVRTDDGQPSSIYKVYVGGFHMGDSSQSLNFNIGMPPS